MKGEKAFANSHHLLSRAKIDMFHGVKVLIEILIPFAGASVVLVVNEYLKRRRREKIKAKATYRDPIASSKSRIINSPYRELFLLFLERVYISKAINLGNDNA